MNGQTPAKAVATTEFAQQETSAPVAAQIKRILVPVDFSDCSVHALRYAVSLAKLVDASLILLHVIDSLIAPPEMEFVHLNIKDFNAELEKHAQAKLTKLAREHIDPTLPATPVLRHGAAWEQIKDAARERKADLIILGTHGHTGIKHMVLGSTAEKVVRLAGCPVLVVRDYTPSPGK